MHAPSPAFPRTPEASGGRPHERPRKVGDLRIDARAARRRPTAGAIFGAAVTETRATGIPEQQGERPIRRGTGAPIRRHLAPHRLRRVDLGHGGESFFSFRLRRPSSTATLSVWTSGSKLRRFPGPCAWGSRPARNDRQQVNSPHVRHPKKYRNANSWRGTYSGGPIVASPTPLHDAF